MVQTTMLCRVTLVVGSIYWYKSWSKKMGRERSFSYEFCRRLCPPKTSESVFWGTDATMDHPNWIQLVKKKPTEIYESNSFDHFWNGWWKMLGILHRNGTGTGKYIGNILKIDENFATFAEGKWQNSNKNRWSAVSWAHGGPWRMWLRFRSPLGRP